MEWSDVYLPGSCSTDCLSGLSFPFPLFALTSFCFKEVVLREARVCLCVTLCVVFVGVAVVHMYGFFSLTSLQSAVNSWFTRTHRRHCDRLLQGCSSPTFRVLVAQGGNSLASS